MHRTKIDWSHTVWNPVTGCSPVSEGCENCYARRFAQRLAGRFGYPKDAPFRVTLHLDRLEEPLRWKKPRRVFVASMGDLFHPEVPKSFLVNVFSVMERANQHTFLLLTKRPVLAKRFFYDFWDGTPHWPLPNLWLGVTAENQARANERIPILLQIPAAVRFVSLEPLLGPVNLKANFWRHVCADCRYQCWHHERPRDRKRNLVCPACGSPYCADDEPLAIHWVIVGAETGPGARPYKPEWVQDIIDQCRAAGVPVFLKGNLRWPEQVQEFPKTDIVKRGDEHG